MMDKRNPDVEAPEPLDKELEDLERHRRYAPAGEPKRFVDRLQHFTWANYTFPMATGGLALLLAPEAQPHTFDGLRTIGKVVFIFDLVIFVLITTAITYRFIRWPGMLKASLTHPTESLFFATSLLSLASIISCIGRYGFPSTGQWLIVVYRVLYWIYFAVTFTSAVGHYTLLFTSPTLKVQDMTPGWDLPIFPVMLCGTIASVGAPFESFDQKIPMIVSGLLAQGLGMMVSVSMFSIYYWRMIQYGFPSPQSRPAMFIAAGPPSFTSLAIIGLANAWPVEQTAYFGGAPEAVARRILMTLATVTATFIWSLSLWFFCIGVIANTLVSVPFVPRKKAIHFALNWWAYVFPNVGFTIATISIGREYDSQGIQWVGSAMTIILIIFYLFVLVNHVRAIVNRTILWPGHDEDTYIIEAASKNRYIQRKSALLGNGSTDANTSNAKDGKKEEKQS